jgi:hypothetical protein
MRVECVISDAPGVMRLEEARLRALLSRAGMLTTGAVGALISIPPEVDAQQIGAAARASFLRHELSHGIFSPILPTPAMLGLSGRRC